MNAPTGLDLASMPERIQSEVQRAIQRSIKGVEYISSSGPSLGSTPKDVLAVRGTMNLYRDVNGKKHHIVVLGHNVAQVRAQLDAYGLPGAVQGLPEAGPDG
jgi:hypothetical protein